MGNTGHGETFLSWTCIGSIVSASWNESGVTL